VSTDCFTCPQPDNYAAVALQLQKTALDAENCIYPLEAQLRAAANRPTVINIGSTAPSIAPSVRTRFGTSTTITFSNSPNLFIQNAFPAGIYETGVWLNATASGATTDNSFRQVEIVTRGLNDPNNVPDDSTVANVMYESNSGLGMDMLLSTTVLLDGTQQIQFWFTHNNASNIIIAAGAIFWCTKISDLTIPRVVI
jgi:hypothetical protein